MKTFKNRVSLRVAQNSQTKKGVKKLSKRIVALFLVTALAFLIQIACLNKPHFSPLPSSIECTMLLSKASLDDGSSLLLDSQGKRVLFTNPEGQLIHVLEFNASNDVISRALEVSSSSQDNAYLVHGVKSIKEGCYLSSESVLVYDNQGNFIRESFHQDFDDTEYVSSVDFLYQDPQPEQLFSLLNESFVIDYSLAFFLKCLIFFLSLIWLLGMMLIGIVWIVKKKKYREAKVVLVALLCVCVTVCFYTTNNFQQIKANFEKNTLIVSSQIENFLTKSNMVSELEKMSESGLDTYLLDSSHQEIVTQLNQSVSELSKAYGKDQSISILITSVSEDNTSHILAFTGNQNAIGKGSVVSDSQLQTLRDNVGKAIQVSTPVVDTVLSACPITNEEGRVIAAVSVSSNVENIFVSQVSKSFELCINLLAVLIGIYVAFAAIKMCIESIIACIRKKETDETDVSNRIVNLSGMYMLIFKFTYNIDKVFVVYIAASLCQGMDPVTQAFYVAIPVTLNFAGQWIGTFFATPLLKIFKEKRLALIMSVISIFIMMFTGWSVLVGSIVLYSIGRGLMGVAISGVLYVISDTLPFHAKTKEQRSKAIEASLHGSTIAAILIALVGGYISQYVGYAFIYVIGAVLCAALFAMVIFTFGRKNPDTLPVKNTSKEKTSYWELWSIFLKPELLMYIIFFTVPNLLVSGYQSYLFPLIASDSGVSAVLLANINVFTLTAMYLSKGTLSKFSRRYSPSVMLVAPSLVVCIGLVCFIVSPTIYWAIIMVFVVSVFNYMTVVSQKTYLIQVSEEYGCEASLVQSNFYTIYSALQTGRSPVLSVFIAMGSYLGCIVLGGVCGIMFGILGVYTKVKGGQSVSPHRATSLDSSQKHST